MNGCNREGSMRLGYFACFVALLVIAGCGSGPVAGDEVKDSGATLVGTTWLTRSIGEAAAVPGVHSTLLFAADGTLSGSGGCNRINGSWQLSGDDLTFGPMAATQMMCLGDRMDQESAFLSSIRGLVRVELSGESLLLRPSEGGEPVRMVPSKPAKLTGAVAYRERMSLPKDATITVRLLDVSKADAPAAVLANQVIVPETQVPVEFSLEYESAEVEARASYAVDAAVQVGDRLLFRSTEYYPVLTHGGPTENVEIELERVR